MPGKARHSSDVIVKTWFGFFPPRGDDLRRAAESGRSRANYIWGTVWLRKNGFYLALPWKLWLGELVAFGILLYVYRDYW